MLSRLIRYELLGLYRDRWLLLLSLLLLFLALFAVANGTARMDKRQAEITTLEEEVRLKEAQAVALIDSLEQGLRAEPAWYSNPRMPSVLSQRYPRLAVMPVAPLSFLATGQSDLFSHFTRVKASGESFLLNFSELANPVQQLFGSFDLAFVLIYLLPLLVIAFSYNVLAGERESGVLRLVAAQPVSVGRWLLGKLLVRYAVLLLLLALAVLVSFALMGVRVGDQGAGLLLLLVLAAAYAFFWFMLALLVNLLGHSSSLNGVTLVAAWVLLVLVVPALVSQGAHTLYPLPSRTVLVNQMRQVKNEATPRIEIILTQYQRDHPELAHADTSQENPQRYWMGYYASQALIQRELTPFLERFEGQLQRQQDWTRGLRFLSPAMLLQGALHDLAGTSSRHYQSYRQQVIAFAGTWRSFFVPMIFRNEQIDREGMSRLPAFRFDPGQVPTHPATDSLALWLYGLGLGGGALLVYRRYAGRRMVG